MALQLLPLLFGGFAAKTAIDRGLASHDRGVLSEGLKSAFGQEQPLPGQAMGQPRDAGNAATYGIGVGVESHGRGATARAAATARAERRRNATATATKFSA